MGSTRGHREIRNVRGSENGAIELGINIHNMAANDIAANNLHCGSTTCFAIFVAGLSAAADTRIKGRIVMVELT
jgi:hypothetical protein